jgi:hypothetical protein
MLVRATKQVAEEYIKQVTCDLKPTQFLQMPTQPLDHVPLSHRAVCTEHPTHLITSHFSPCPFVSPYLVQNEFPTQPISLSSPEFPSEYEHHGDAAQAGLPQVGIAAQLAPLWQFAASVLRRRRLLGPRHE